MKDNEIRGLVLQKYYEKRRDGYFQWCECTGEELGSQFEAVGDDLFRICDQLAQHGLIDWNPLPGTDGKTIGGIGKISAFGVDVVEGTTRSPITVTFEQGVRITNSANVQVGDHNYLSAPMNVERFNFAIDHSSFSPEEKAEAKSQLSKFLEHPIIASVVGGLASTLNK